jgi:formamidopyrimidine-DNA glycosylase
MPELPDIAGFCRLFRDHLAGKRIASVVVHKTEVVRGRPVDAFVRGIEGRQFEEPFRHGKWLFGPMQGPGTLLLHFGMTGRLRWEPSTSCTRRFDRVEFHVCDGTVMFEDRRNLGRMWLTESTEESREITGPLGPDALGITATDLEELFAGTRTLKALLMDQRVLAGLGNMLSDEVLWRSRIHPATRGGALGRDRAEDFADSLDLLLREAVRAGEIPRSPGWLASQRSRPDPACPRCRTGLRATRIAGRTSHWCPACQTPPR